MAAGSKWGQAAYPNYGSRLSALMRAAPGGISSLAIASLLLVASSLAQAVAAAQGSDSTAVFAPVVGGAAHRADSLAFVGDSAAAIAVLDAALRHDRRDAAAWHRRGMLAWATARLRREAGFIKRRDDITQLRLADSALRTAAALAPDSARYGVDLGRFLLNSKLTTTRFAAQEVLRRSLETARRVGDAAARAAAADEVGMIYWRRYE